MARRYEQIIICQQTLGSSAILNQENHFKNIVDGKLESTTLWQGVMNK